MQYLFLGINIETLQELAELRAFAHLLLLLASNEQHESEIFLKQTSFFFQRLQLIERLTDLFHPDQLQLL